MPPINKIVVITLIRRILTYSAIKINVNPTLLYSTLNPDTNSDSPSTKSNGVRLVSAITAISQIMNIDGIINDIQNDCCNSIILLLLNDRIIINGVSIAIAMVIS